MSKKTQNIQYYEGVGRRKTAIARVRLFIPEKQKTVEVNGVKIKPGEVYVNGKPITTLFARKIEEKLYFSPFEITNTTNRFAVSIKVAGGGKKSQLEAIVHGMARALILVNEQEYKPILREKGLLTRDPRVRQRRQVGTGGKARRKKQSPKR